MLRISIIIFKSLMMIFLLSIFKYSIASSYEIKIIQKIGKEIITNIDVEKEYQYLKALNKKMKTLKEQEIFLIAKESIIKEKIKKNEILKYFNLEKKNKNIVSNIIKNIYLSLEIQNESDFEKYLNGHGITLEEIYNKIEIEVIWNQLIYEKYNKQININKELIGKKILEKKGKNQTSYNLSEIFFLANTKDEVSKKYEEIQIQINKIGFNKTAFLYSKSESRSQEGLLGWISENQLSEKIKTELNNLKIGEITPPISITDGALILKINDLRKEVKEVNFEVELETYVKFEKERQLSNYSWIYFNKVKDILINE